MIRKYYTKDTNSGDLSEVSKIISDKNSDMNNSNNYKRSTKAIQKQTVYVSKELNVNKSFLNKVFNNCVDVIIREINIASNPQYPAFIIYIANLTPIELVEECVIERLIRYQFAENADFNNINYYEGLLGVGKEDTYNDMDKVIDSILQGNLILFVNGISRSIAVTLKNPPNRSVEKSDTELSLRGPKESLNESIAVNLALIRKRMKNKYLKTERIKVGTNTQTDITIIYLENIANDKIVNEVRTRIKKIRTDAIYDSNDLQEFIGDARKSMFPTAFITEKPDTVISKLLEGRVAIITDGSPSAITVPAVFMEFLQVGEDYYIRYIPTTFNRWIRYFLFLVSILLPGFYVAIITFHQELLPTALLITVIKGRSNVPFPTLLETLVMVFAFDALREAGLRMPRALGQAISIVGALVLGEAAVSAGLVSELIVIVVAFTGISSFTLGYPEMYMSILVPRYIFVLLGGTLGLLGLNCGMIALLINFTSKRSFGVPYMAPIMPMVKDELDDAVIRSPMPDMKNRPKIMTWAHSIRKHKTNKN